MALRLREALGEFGDDVAQTVDLFLAHDVSDRPARILDLFLPVHHLPDASRLFALRVPDMDGEDQRVAARSIVENRLDRRVRENPAVPVKIAIDAHGRESRRQRARRHYVTNGEGHVPAVEIAHLARADLGRPDGQSGRGPCDEREIDELGQRLLQWHGRVISRAFRRERHMPAEEGDRVWPEEPGDAGGKRLPVRQARADPGQHRQRLKRRRMFDAAPELAQLREPVGRPVAGDNRGVDRADRSADHPVRLDARFVQCLVDAGLIGAERAAALKDQNDLPERST